MYGRKVRARLLWKAQEFKHPALFTLTLKPDHFGNDPRKGFETVTDKRYIAQLMKRLGVKRWVCVLEFQKSGWAHWHLLVDKPGGYLDLKKAWALWGWKRDGWKLGGVDLGLQKVNDGAHAVRYITKYLIKFPEDGFPDWVLDLPRRIRWVNASRCVGRVVSDAEVTSDSVKGRENETEAEASLPVKHRSLRVRQVECGQGVDFLREFLDVDSGAMTYRFAGRLGSSIFERAKHERAMHVLSDEEGREYIADPGDMRGFMALVVRKVHPDGKQPGWLRAADARWLGAVAAQHESGRKNKAGGTP